MPIDAVTATSGASTTPSPARVPKQTMDADVFMSLLVSQLRNQDPSSPMDTNEMIAQTTQLAMMEKITQLTATNEENFSLQMRIAASSLLGQQVSFARADGSTVTGTATAVSYAGPIPKVTVGGEEVALDSLSGVNTASAS